MKRKKIYDFIIVGQGIAGTVFACTLLKLNKSFVIVDSLSPKTTSPSKIALGVYNPLVLKWITKVSKAEIKLDTLFSYCDFFFLIKYILHLLKQIVNHFLNNLLVSC